MKKCYVNGVGAISVQHYKEEDFTQDLQCVSSLLNAAQEPDYKTVIAPNLLRRMSKAIKMGVFASNKALTEAQIPMPEAIIIGSALGCLSDSEKFLKNLTENQEEFLTPTAFIQSTHNTVAAQIALQLKCNAYNLTYVNGGNSFEAALLDGLIQIQTEESNEILVGGIEEIGATTHRLLQLAKVIKTNDNSVGARFGEGATFFGLSADKTENSYAEIVDVKLQNRVEKGEIQAFVSDFLKQHNLEVEEIDAFFIGKNDDQRFDDYYSSFLNQNFADVCVYKAFSGEYETASAYGMLLACEVLKKQAIESILQLKKSGKKEYRNIILYNQFLGKNHSLVLLKNVDA